MKDKPRTWLEINTEAIKFNYRQLKGYLPRGTKVIAVVKSNAYGHGIVEISNIVLREGASYVAVSFLEDAAFLRRSGYRKPILILSQPDISKLPVLIKLNAIPCINDYRFAKSLSDICKGKFLCPVHIEIDTGMNHLGLPCENAIKELKRIAAQPNIQIEGIFTHLSDADNPKTSVTKKQIIIFNKVIGGAKSVGINADFVHVSCSSGLFSFPQNIYNSVRVGSIIYGIQSSLDKNYPVKVRQSLSWKTVILGTKKIGKGEYIGYGHSWKAKKDISAAVIPVGYADGFRRSPNNFRFVLCSGEKCPIIGLVGMNQTMLDVSKIKNIQRGNEVVLIGKQGRNRITIEDVAKEIGSIGEEVTVGISPNIPRLYFKRSAASL